MDLDTYDQSQSPKCKIIFLCSLTRQCKPDQRTSAPHLSVASTAFRDCSCPFLTEGSLSTLMFKNIAVHCGKVHRQLIIYHQRVNIKYPLLLAELRKYSRILQLGVTSFPLGRLTDGMAWWWCSMMKFWGLVFFLGNKKRSKTSRNTILLHQTTMRNVEVCSGAKQKGACISRTSSVFSQSGNQIKEESLSRNPILWTTSRTLCNDFLLPINELIHFLWQSWPVKKIHAYSYLLFNGTSRYTYLDIKLDISIAFWHDCLLRNISRIQESK